MKLNLELLEESLVMTPCVQKKCLVLRCDHRHKGSTYITPKMNSHAHHLQDLKLHIEMAHYSAAPVEVKQPVVEATTAAPRTP